MGLLFKSKEERKMERDIEMRKGLNAIRRNIKNLEKHEKGYIQKARRAKQIGALDQVAFLKQTLKRTLSQKSVLNRQLLALETAIQMKNQAEAHAQFARSMNSMCKAIAVAFGNTDLLNTQREFEKAMSKAQSMEERMELFLDMGSESLMDEAPGEELISDEALEKIIDTQIEEDEGGGLDEEIAQDLKDIEKELGQNP